MFLSSRHRSLGSICQSVVDTGDNGTAEVSENKVLVLFFPKRELGDTVEALMPAHMVWWL